MNTHKNMDFFEYWEETRKYPRLREEEIHQILQKTDKTEADNQGCITRCATNQGARVGNVPCRRRAAATRGPCCRGP